MKRKITFSYSRMSFDSSIVEEKVDLLLTGNTFVNLNTVRDLYKFNMHFGLKNFLNIFRVFYLLSHIPDDAENNPFAL